MVADAQIGQLASTRADFLPPQYYDRVKMLQSDTPAEPLDYIRRERERDINTQKT